MAWGEDEWVKYINESILSSTHPSESNTNWHEWDDDEWKRNVCEMNQYRRLREEEIGGDISREIVLHGRSNSPDDVRGQRKFSNSHPPFTSWFTFHRTPQAWKYVKIEITLLWNWTRAAGISDECVTTWPPAPRVACSWASDTRCTVVNSNTACWVMQRLLLAIDSCNFTNRFTQRLKILRTEALHWWIVCTLLSYYIEFIRLSNAVGYTLRCTRDNSLRPLMMSLASKLYRPIGPKQVLQWI